MRSYIGERDDNGRPDVWVFEEPPPSSPAEISDLLADLPSVSAPARTEPGWPKRRAAWLLRKVTLLTRGEAAINPARRSLPRQPTHPDGFEWGHDGDGPTDLAHAILTDHLGVEPTPLVAREFCEHVVSALPEERFRIPASLVGAWVAAHRDLIDRELFLNPPHDEPAWSVTDSAPPVEANGTRPVDDPASASALIAACEGAWSDIRVHHPELPEAVMVLGTGVERGRLVKLGHWWGGQWVADGQSRGEVLLAGEALHLEPARVFEVLLHESAHGINAARGVKDTSRGGRYHNKHFASTARQVLLDVRQMPPYGLAATELTPAARERYGPTIDRLGDAMRIARQLRAGIRIGVEGDGIEGTLGGGADGGKERGDGQPKGPGSAACGCGRKMRMAPSTLAAGPVLCGLCDSEFTVGAERQQQRQQIADIADAAGPAGAVVDRGFVERRQQAIAAEAVGGAAPELDEAVVRILDRQRTRLEAMLQAAPDHDDRVVRAVADRRDRLEHVLTRSLADTPGGAVVRLAAADAAGATEVRGTTQVDADHDALRHWYESYGTLDEQPMQAATATEAARRQRLARSLLKADGTLHGPAVTTAVGTELQAGDRVLPSADHDDLPARTLGTVEHVDAVSGTVDIDFATWGRLRTRLNDSITRDLRHDYAAVHPAEQELPGPEVGL